MASVRVSFGPVYWIHNNSIVPTTTTTSTTSTTTTSTEPTTTKQKESIYPGMQPPLEVFDDDNNLPADQQSQESEIRNVEMSPEEIRKGKMEAVKVNEGSSGFVHRISSMSAVVAVLSVCLSRLLF